MGGLALSYVLWRTEGNECIFYNLLITLFINELSTGLTHHTHHTQSSPLSIPKIQYISAATSSNDVVVFSKSYCPFCTSTKNLFAEMGTELGLSSPPFVVELDNLPGGGDVQNELLKITGQRTVPNVFVKGKHLGGNDDTQRAAADGTISQMLGK